jgi:HK97 family phage major capsid protein
MPPSPNIVTPSLRLARAGFNPQDLSDEHRAALKAGVAEFRAQSTTAAAGGYTVPTDLAAQVDKTMKMWGPMYDEAICTVLNTASGNAIDFPTTLTTLRLPLFSTPKARP